MIRPCERFVLTLLFLVGGDDDRENEKKRKRESEREGKNEREKKSGRRKTARLPNATPMVRRQLSWRRKFERLEKILVWFRPRL